MPAAVIYCRVSSDQGGTSRSVEQQEAECRAFCKRKRWTVAEVVTDSDISASRYSTKARPGWARVLELVESGAVGALVAWDLDRLLRQPKQLEHLIDLAEDGLPVVTLGGGDLNLATPDGRFIARILVAKAAKESDDTSRRVRRAKAAKAARGEPARLAMGEVRAFGWLDGMTPDVAEAEVIRSAARRVLDGSIGITALAREWNEANHRRPRSARQWSSTTVRAVLESPRNAGLAVSRGEVVGEGQWPAIIDRATYERLRRYFADPARKSAPRRMSDLTGVYRCALCGHTLQRDQVKGRVIWRCKPSPGLRCGRIGLTAGPEPDLSTDPAARPTTDARGPDELVIWSVLARVEGRLPGPKVDASATDLSELADVERRLTEAAEDFADGKLSRAQLLAITARLEPRRDALAAQVSNANDSFRAAIDRYAGTPGELRTAWPSLSPKARNTIVKAVIEAVVVHPGRRVRGFDPERLEVKWR